MLRIVVVLFLLLTGLISKDLEKVSIQLQWLDQFQFAGYYIAKEKGFYSDIGLDVEIKKYKHGINVVNEVVSKRATFGVGRSSLVVEKGRGKNLKILSAIFQTSPLILLAREDSNINSIRDFKNKKIMTTSDLIENVSLRAMMNKYGIQFSDMEHQKHSFNYEDIINRKTDLMASYISNEPYRMKSKGVGYRIFDPKDHGFETYGDILFTSDSEIELNKKRVELFIEASLKGWRYAFNNIDETVDILFKKYNGHNKTKDALRFEAYELKKLAFYQTEQLGEIQKSKIQRIYDMFNILGLIGKNYNIDDILYSYKNQMEIKLSKNQKEYLKNKKSIKMCINNSWRPIEFLSDDIPQGISIDMIKIIEKKFNLSFEYVKTNSWSESQEFLKQRKCDILPSAVKTDKRLEYANFTKKYITYDLAIITSNDKPFVAGISSLLDKKMARNKGSALIPKLKKVYPELDIKVTSSYEKSLEDVSHKNVYFTIETLPVYNYYKNLYHLDNLHIAGYTDMKYDLRIAIRNDDPILLSIMNRALGVISDDTMSLIYEKWINKDIIKEIDYELVGYIVSVFGILFFIVLFFMMKQNKLKETIEEQKEVFETLYEKSSDGIMLVSDGKFIDCNESIVNLLGYKEKKELLNLHPAELSPKKQPDGKNSLEKSETMMKIALEKGSNTFEWVHTRANGEEFWAEIVLTKINISGKDILHVVLRDVNRRKRAEKLLEDMNLTLQEKVESEVQKNREKDKQMFAQSRLAQMGEMISMIAHQWRQPLAAISSTTINLKFKLELKTYDLKEELQRKEYEKFFIKELGDIEHYIQSLTTTIEDFRNFYKPNRPRVKELVQKPISKALNILKNSSEVDGIKYVENYQDSVEVLMYDSELMQVFLNIMKNAQDVLKERNTQNKTITISTENIVNGAKIIICDSGGGIPNDIIQNIFDPYFSTKLEKNGTGLGLYMSKTIVEEHHNGYIKAYNKNDGACFEIVIKEE